MDRGRKTEGQTNTSKHEIYSLTVESMAVASEVAESMSVSTVAEDNSVSESMSVSTVSVSTVSVSVTVCDWGNGVGGNWVGGSDGDLSDSEADGGHLVGSAEGGGSRVGGGGSWLVGGDMGAEAVAVGDVLDDTDAAVRVSQAVRADFVAPGISGLLTEGAAAGVALLVSEVVVALELHDWGEVGRVLGEQQISTSISRVILSRLMSTETLRWLVILSQMKATR